MGHTASSKTKQRVEETDRRKRKRSSAKCISVQLTRFVRWWRATRCGHDRRFESESKRALIHASEKCLKVVKCGVGRKAINSFEFVLMPEAIGWVRYKRSVADSTQAHKRMEGSKF
jgi:hypothetical protein